VTKIPSLGCVNLASRILEKNIFRHLPIKILSVKVDNITAVTDVERELHLLKIAKKIETDYNLAYNNEKFPGIFVKLPEGTIIIFTQEKLSPSALKIKRT